MATRPTRLKVHLPSAHHCASYKIAYGSYEAALDAAERQMQLGLVTPGCHITPYHCPRCGAWHVYNRVIVLLPGVNSAPTPWYLRWLDRWTKA